MTAPATAPTIALMNPELDHLEQRVDELIRLFNAYKQENRELKSRVAALQAENTQLAGKVEAAIDGVSAVLDSLPER